MSRIRTTRQATEIREGIKLGRDLYSIGADYPLLQTIVTIYAENARNAAVETWQFAKTVEVYGKTKALKWRRK